MNINILHKDDFTIWNVTAALDVDSARTVLTVGCRWPRVSFYPSRYVTLEWQLWWKLYAILWSVDIEARFVWLFILFIVCFMVWVAFTPGFALGGKRE